MEGQALTGSVMLNAMIYATIACFPLLMLATVVIFFAKKRGSAFLRSNPSARRVYDRIVAAGPKEGWSGYVILAIVLLWLAVMAGLLFVSIESGDPRDRKPSVQGSLEHAEMMYIEMDGGGYGYISESAMNDAIDELIQSGQIPGEVQIPAYSDDGEIIGEYTVRVEAG